MNEKVKRVIDSVLEGSQYFLTELKVSGNSSKIAVYLDGDNGISVDTCAKFSRKIGRILEEQDLIDHAYVLEVSSPGLSKPLVHYRQYKKNVNRNLKVIIDEENSQVSGMLVYVDRKGIVLKSNKRNLDSYDYDEISEAKVVI